MKSFIRKFLLLSCLVSLSTWAHKKAHREHHAHSHGQAHLSIAFDSLKGKIEFKSPADSVLGFEYEAKSKKDKKKLADTITDFESQIANYVQFDSKSLCVFAVKKVGRVADEKDNSHTDFVAQYNITCAQPVLNTKLTLDFSSFKKIKNIDTVILINELQLKPEVKSKKTTIDLK